ncbi:hypothetical protein QL285_009971 [Trifolium repens]|nr:hypothetical protein QL285_009971 [Trifolium repens]
MKVFRIAPGGVTTPPYIVVGACAQGDRENSKCRPILPTATYLDALSPVPWRAEDEKIKVFRIAPRGVTTPPYIVVGACAQGDRENSKCRPILPTATYLDALSPVPWRAEDEKIKVFRIAPRGVTTPPYIVVGACAQGERENSKCRPILPTAPYLDALSPVPWRAGVEKMKVFRINPGGVTTPPYIVVGACAQVERENSKCRPILPTAPYLDALSPVPWRAEDEKIKVFRIDPGGVTTPPYIVVGACAQGERENSKCRPILPTAPYLDALSPVPWRAGVEKMKVFRINPGGVTTPPYIVVGACAQVERENSKCRPILPTAPYLDALSPVPWRAEDEKMKVFRINPGGVTTPPYIVVGACAQVERENSKCRPILPTAPYLDALSPVPWRAEDEKIKVFRIHPGGVTTPPYIVVGACAQVERENSKCRPILPTAPYLDALSPVPWRAEDEKIKVFRIHPGGVTTPPYIVVGACAQVERENSKCRPILPTAPYLDALSPVPWRAEDEKIKVFRIHPGGVTTPPYIVVGACAQVERENSKCRPILPTAPYLDALSPVPWRAEDEKMKVFRINPGGVTTPPYIVVGACAQVERENSKCRPILPTAPYLDALSPVPWRAEDEKIKVFRIHPGGVTTPPYIVVGACAQVERENSKCRPILPTAPYLDALSPVPWRAEDEKIKVFRIHPGGVTTPPYIVVGACAQVERENSKCRPILPTAPYLDALSPVPWRAEDEKIKVFRNA